MDLKTTPYRYYLYNFINIEQLVWSNLGPKKYFMAAVDEHSDERYIVYIKSRRSPALYDFSLTKLIL